MTWHFRYDGPGFEVIGLDTRTWRGFEPEANESIRERFSDEADRDAAHRRGAAHADPRAAGDRGQPRRRVLRDRRRPVHRLPDRRERRAAADQPARHRQGGQTRRAVRALAEVVLRRTCRPGPGELGLRAVAVRERAGPAVHPPARRVPLRRRALRVHDADGLLGARPGVGAAHGDTRRAAHRQLVPRPARRPRPARGDRPRPADRHRHVGADTARLASRRHRFARPQRRRCWPAPTRSPRTCRCLLTEDPIVVPYDGVPASATSSRATRSGRGRRRPCSISRSDEDRFAQVDPPPPFVQRVGDRPGPLGRRAALLGVAAGDATQLAVVDELHHHRLHQARDRTASSTRCSTASTASTRRARTR